MPLPVHIPSPLGTPAPAQFPANVPDNEIHLWCVTGDDIDDADVVRQNEVHLCDSERARAERFHRQQDRNRFVIGRGILRRALGAYLAVEPHDIAFSKNRYGRPEIAAHGQKPVYFNTSHTDGIVATVLSSGGEVGIDAERIRANFPHLDVARRHFPSSNHAELERLSSPLRQARFCEFWVLLEAYAKGRGMGLSLPFANAVFGFESAAPSTLSFSATDAPEEQWRFGLMMHSLDHRLAVAASGRNDRIVARRLRPDRAEAFHLAVLASGPDLKRL